MVKDKHHTKRKKRLDIKTLGKCNPATRRTRRCLPSSLYNQVEDGKCAEDDDHCVIDHLNIGVSQKNHLRKAYLRPRYPDEWKSDPDAWLSNFDIMRVMKQYQEAYPSFKFMPIQSIDFSAPSPYVKDKLQCLSPDMCELNLKKEYNNGVRSIGIVFNLDPHYKGGSHWVGMYICIENIKAPWCGYFDSYGYNVPQFIARFMRSLKLQCKNTKLMYNARRFQYSNSECGMFSMFFILSMLSGIPFRTFCKNPASDSDMLRLRKILFTGN
jgi:hypothetical protein